MDANNVGSVPVNETDQYGNRKPSSTLALDDNGQIVGINGTNAPLSFDWYAKRAPLGFALVEPPLSGIGSAAGAGCTINSSAATTVNGETVWQISATGTAGTNNYFEVSVPTQSQEFAASDMTAEIMFDDMANLGVNGMTFYLGTASYTTFANYSIGTQLTPSTGASHALNGVFTAYQVHESLWTKNSYSDATGNQAWVNCKIRVYVTNGSTLVFTLRAIRVGAYKRKARIAIVSDDGYRSWFKMGMPIMREFGFCSSLSLIYDVIGSHSDKVTLAQAKQYVAEGNECLPHGPNDLSGGSGNLFTVYSNNADRMDDVVRCRDFLLANGLCTQWGARSYIWPQGRFCESASDLSLLSLMRAEGFKIARGVAVPTNFYMHKLQAIDEDNMMPMIMPIVGHTFTNAGAEAANIAAIKTRIAAVAANGGDCSLMLHRVVGVDAATLSTDISSNRLRELLQAIKDEVDAGKMEVVLFSEFCK